jgi:manganese-dependent inorganic pyrophosphatase
MVTKHIIGHKSPDTDTTCSSIAYGELLSQKGEDVKVIKLGELNNETKFVLEKFGIEEPETLSVLEDGSQIILMDHNEAKQSIDGREKLKIVQIIDHHRFDFSVKEPLMIRAEPLGSTCSIVAKMYFESGLNLSKEIAGILISSILSDTLNFKSATTTKEDKEIVAKLNEIVKIEDLNSFALEMFNAKSDLGDIDVDELVKLDYKIFEINGKRVGVGVMETTNPDYGLDRKEEIIAELKRVEKEDSLDFVFFSIIDILKEINFTLFSNEAGEDLLKRGFNATVESEVASLGRILSRKKQIIPKFEEFMK